MRRLIRLEVWVFALWLPVSGCFKYPLSETREPLDPALVGTWISDKNEKIDLRAVDDHYAIDVTDEKGKKDTNFAEGHSVRANSQNLLQLIEANKKKNDPDWIILRYEIHGDVLSLYKPNTDRYFDGKSFPSQSAFRGYFLGRSSETDFWLKDVISLKKAHAAAALPATRPDASRIRASQPGAPASGELLKKLQSRVADEGPFDPALYQHLVLALHKADPAKKADEELIATSQDFVEGRLRPSVFVAYLREVLALPGGSDAGEPDFSNSAVGSSDTMGAMPSVDISGSQRKSGPIGQTGPSENPFDKFRENLNPGKDSTTPRESGRKPSKGSKETGRDDPFAKFRESAPKSKPSAGGLAGQARTDVLNLYCTGNLNRYAEQQYTRTEDFEFRTSISLRENRHTVENVLKGPLFKSGTGYEASRGERDVFTLGVESTDPHYQLTTVHYDRVAGRLTGRGSLNMSQERDALLERFRLLGLKLPPGYRLSGTDDSLRHFEVDGLCQPY